MCRPRNSAPFLLSSRRHCLRLALTSRMPTVICVGCNSLMGTGLSTGSRTWIILSSLALWLAKSRLANDPTEPAATVQQRELASHAEPYGYEDEQTTKDVINGQALTQEQDGEYHD